MIDRMWEKPIFLLSKKVLLLRMQKKAFYDRIMLLSFHKKINPMLAILQSLDTFLYGCMLIGLLGTTALAFKERGPTYALLVLLIPFYYCFKYLFAMEDSNIKKILSIFTMGGLLLFVFVQIIVLVLTPPL